MKQMKNPVATRREERRGVSDADGLGAETVSTWQQIGDVVARVLGKVSEKNGAGE